MAQTSKHTDAPTTTPPDSSTVVLLLGTIGDTTWRMFVPTIGLALAGDFADRMLATRPWLMLAGFAIGSVIAAALVKKQLQKTKKS